MAEHEQDFCVRDGDGNVDWRASWEADLVRMSDGLAKLTAPRPTLWQRIRGWFRHDR